MIKQTSQIDRVANPNSHDRILDAAEEEFSRNGFDGSGMKAISLTAGVAQGLLHYHFGNKEKLYEAVIARRSTMISNARETYLAEVDLQAPDALEGIFTALYRPAMEKDGGGRAYAIIFAGLAVSSESSAELVRKYYDPTARLFIDAMRTAEPNASKMTAAWSYTLAIGALVATIGHQGRRDRLASSRQSNTNYSIEEQMRPLVINAAGGFRALIEGYKTTT
ncbi:MAG: TetR/AcrR family transcriptional regulator [Rhizobiaceae bacterium]